MSARRGGRRSRRRALLAALACGALAAMAPLTVRAQSLDGTVRIFSVERRLLYRGAFYEQRAVFAGGEGAVQWGRVRLGLSGIAGSLDADIDPVAGSVRIRSTAATLHVAVSPAILVGVRREMRRFDSEAGTTLWRLTGPEVRAEPGLGLPGLRGIVHVAAFTSAELRDGPAMTRAFQTTLGMRWNPFRAPFHVALAYRFERYDLPATTAWARRLEQFRGMVVEAGARLGR